MLTNVQGSVMTDQLSSASQDATEDARQQLKSRLRLAWSGEAVKQGVSHAKKGEYDAALGCYKKVDFLCIIPHLLCIMIFICYQRSSSCYCISSLHCQRVACRRTMSNGAVMQNITMHAYVCLPTGTFAVWHRHLILTDGMWMLG